MKKPLRTNRIIADLTAGAKVYGTETSAKDAIYSALNSENDIERTWLLTEEGYRSLALIDLGSSKWMGVLISPDKGYLYVYEAEGALNVESGKAVGPTFRFISQEDANDTSAQLLKWEVEENDVVANPSETATQDLTKIKIDGTAYNLKAGTEVTANPTLAGTESALTGLEVDGTKYSTISLLSGGAGSNRTIEEFNTFAVGDPMNLKTYNNFKVVLQGVLNNSLFDYDSTHGVAYPQAVADDSFGTMVYNFAGAPLALTNYNVPASTKDDGFNIMMFMAACDKSAGTYEDNVLYTTKDLKLEIDNANLSQANITETANFYGFIEVKLVVVRGADPYYGLTIKSGNQDLTQLWLYDGLESLLGVPIVFLLYRLQSCFTMSDANWYHTVD